MTTDMERVIEDFAEAWSSHDAERIASFFAEGAVYDEVPVGELTHDGEQRVRSFATDTFAAMPDFKAELSFVFGVGDRAAGEGVLTGTQTGEMPPYPATGKSIAVPFAIIAEGEEGKLKRIAVYWDLASFLRQLGLGMEVPS
jgi:steroid delta-isomerase-like uncharacterized protein